MTDNREYEYRGLIARSWERSMFDPNTQLRHTEGRYEFIENDGVLYTEVHRRSPELRSYSLSQITEMFGKSGFTEIQALSGFSSDPASDEDDVFCNLGTRN